MNKNSKTKMVIKSKDYNVLYTHPSQKNHGVIFPG